MLLPRLTALFLATTAVSAVQRTSPFALLSSTPLDADHALQGVPLTKAEALERRVVHSLAACDRKWYYIFTQQQVTADDWRESTMPQVSGLVAQGVKSGLVAEFPAVLGVLDERDMREQLVAACDRMGKKATDDWPEAADEYRIITMPMPDLPADEKSRAQALRDTDTALAPTVNTVLSGAQNAVLLYLTSPPARRPTAPEDVPDHHPHTYHMDDPYPSSLHTELKRDLHARDGDGDGDSDGNDNMQAGLPLFEKYQFLTPGLFMGLTISVPLLAMMFVGLRALGSLEVSYKAFDKEMGPQAQNKGKLQ